MVPSQVLTHKNITLNESSHQVFVDGNKIELTIKEYLLLRLFRLRFSPTERDDGAAASQVRAIEKALEKVPNASEDRVLREYLALMQATLRTNYWRTGEGAGGAAGPRRGWTLRSAPGRA